MCKKPVRRGKSLKSPYHLGDLVDVVVEEAGIGNDGVRGERLHTRAGRERGARLIEGDVAVVAHA